MSQRVVVALIGCSAALGCLAKTQRVRIAEPSHLSSPDEFALRRGIDLLPAEREALSYELAVESFELYAPATVEGAGPAVGFVWISAGPFGAPPRGWAPALDRHRVFWIGANASGNRRSPPDRLNLALDAAGYLRSFLDAERPSVYVGGFSGGARIASEAALLYPDIFAGAMMLGAADYFRMVGSSDPRWSAWAPTFPPPSPDLLRMAQSRSRYVFVTGSRDSNRALVRDVHTAYVADGFSATTLLDVTGLRHTLPPLECFEHALLELLSPSPEVPQPLTPITPPGCRYVRDGP